MVEPLFGMGDDGEVQEMSEAERDELYRLVAEVRRHQKDYRRVGEALYLIETKGLYRGFGTFESFLRSCLEMESRYAFYLIQAYEVAVDLCTVVQELPENEAQCRELAVLKTPEARQKAWKAVLAFAGDQQKTAEMVREIVRPMLLVRRPTHKPAAPLPVSDDYGVILADPPWQYESNSTTPDRDIEEHYPTMTLEDIKQLPVAELAANHCVLFLWTTAPKVLEAGEVIRAWGFNYRTNLIWHKSGMGLGHYIRVNHEHLMIAIRGNPGTPDTPVRPSSPVPAPELPSTVIYAKKLRHSQKPALFHEIIEAMYPGERRLELFARSPREGWDVWGNEVE